MCPCTLQMCTFPCWSRQNASMAFGKEHKSCTSMGNMTWHRALMVHDAFLLHESPGPHIFTLQGAVTIAVCEHSSILT